MFLGTFDVERQKLSPIIEAPQPAAPDKKIREVVEVLKNAKAPLVVLGKGAAYARAEKQIKTMIERYGFPALYLDFQRQRKDVD